MNSNEIRNIFLDFFKSKNHTYVPSSPMVVKNDPTLMFTNAGMNQFKDIFLGNSAANYTRVANSQKCLRVSGKHNDLEEVGHDTYHHTMFEMLGNWSFGDYFKKEAIEWAWELLADVYKIPKDRLYVTVFEGSKEENLEPDNEAKEIWQKYIDADRIIYGNKKDNFWEMGETGPCGPCSEIHVDIRSDEERKKIDGKSLVNTGHHLVIEIWNNVFIQYNRKADGSLEQLPAKHVDTGMGFERLCMVIQGKQSNYDTDVFQTIIQSISKNSGIEYGSSTETDIAMRVIADHLRAVSFSIADGQLPSNNKAGYVIRRILRRAVRYGYTFLHRNEPFIYKLVPVLVSQLGHYFTELKSQQTLIEKVIQEEEASFLRTLETGIKLLDNIIDNCKKTSVSVISGKTAFELYDTYGFPLDLTQLIAREHNLSINQSEFDSEMEEQKNRSRSAAATTTDDWNELIKSDSVEFTGYDSLSTDVKITKFRKVKQKNKEFYQLVFDKTPFYGESGGQVGDKGYIETINERIDVVDTQKENNLTVHIVNELPTDITAVFHAVVDTISRTYTAYNHTATHLLHESLREILGSHVEQKGSLVNSEYLRFDFAHFQKLTDEEIQAVEKSVNQKIRANFKLNEKRAIPMDEAKKIGAIALFGEKYGDKVRVINFGTSTELCGGTHVNSTGEIGQFKLMSETAIAAGIRRIEAITGYNAEEYVNSQLSLLKEIKSIFKNPKDVIKSIENVISERDEMIKKVEAFNHERVIVLAKSLHAKIKSQNGINILAEKIEIDSAGSLKDLCLLIKQQSENFFGVLACEIAGKATVAVVISDNLVKEKGLNAGKIVKEISKEINGGGGGQDSFATAGGTKPAGINAAFEKALVFCL